MTNEGAEPPTRSEPNRPNPRRRWIVLAVVLVAIALAGAAVGVLRSRGGGEQVTLQEAEEQFRKATGTTQPESLLVPQAGVYTYAGTGTEALSIPGTAQTWGPTLPGTVTQGEPGCWTFRIDYSTNHWQDTTYCAVGSVLQERAGTTFQQFDLLGAKVGDTTNFRCDPPGELVRLDAVPGTSWTQSCTGKGTSQPTTVESAGTNTFVGTEDVLIGGTPVRALHMRVERTISRDQHGTETTDEWFAADTGLPLRVETSVDVASPSPIGDVHFTQNGRYELSASSPRT